MKNILLTDPVVQMCRWLEKSDQAIPLSELSSKTGWSVSQVHRMFKKKIDMTPHQYWEQVRASRLRQALVNATTVLDGAVSAGYSSMGRLHEDSQASLGMPPSAYRKGGKGTKITFALGKCWLGHFLVAQTEKGSLARGRRSLAAGPKSASPVRPAVPGRRSVRHCPAHRPPARSAAGNSQLSSGAIRRPPVTDGIRVNGPKAPQARLSFTAKPIN